jgi:threonylcarbamoyladenosine tRNA methylthiotransferase MtaB
MRTFSIVTLGCKVNQYESDQIAAILRARGLRQVEADGDVRIVNTCSVTVQAASKSRQMTRRAGRSSASHLSLPVLQGGSSDSSAHSLVEKPLTATAISAGAFKPRVIVTGCWATSDRKEAEELPGVDAVLGHHDDVPADLNRLLTEWMKNNETRSDLEGGLKVETSVDNKTQSPQGVNRNLVRILSVKSGTISLPQLGARQTGHQRAFLKIQDGCDAHCTYCIIPQLRPKLWSKSADDAVAEAQNLVDAGHQEIVLTGIFMGAYGQTTALRRRQEHATGKPLGELVEALCTRVRGLKRLRLSSLEPGDLSPELVSVLKSHPQVVPHFHLPLQSGSDALLHRMNRQYTSADFLAMIDTVRAAFDRPALTTDIIVGFPGETHSEFARTLEVVERVKFIHIHAFPYSPRPRTAAARWTKDFVRGPVVNERIDELRRRADEHSLVYRRQFVGETVEVLVERPSAGEREVAELAGSQHGRCERYFAVHFESDRSRVGEALKVRIDRATSHRTIGTVLESSDSHEDV